MNNNMKTINIKKLLSDFTDQRVAYYEQVDKLFNGSYQDSGKPFRCTVNAVESIIMPLFKALKEHFPQLQLLDKNGFYGLEGGYYKMRIGDRAIGGFDYPRKGGYFLIYTPFIGNLENKKNYNITSLRQVVRIIDKQLKYYESIRQ